MSIDPHRTNHHIVNGLGHGVFFLAVKSLVRWSEQCQLGLLADTGDIIGGWHPEEAEARHGPLNTKRPLQVVDFSVLTARLT